MSRNLKPIQPGDKVRCLNATCSDPVKAGKLKVGKEYTVRHIGDWSVYLEEQPHLQFNLDRFARVQVGRK